MNNTINTVSIFSLAVLKTLVVLEDICRKQTKLQLLLLLSNLMPEGHTSYTVEFNSA